MSQRLKQLFPGFLWLIVLAALAVALVLLLSQAAGQRIAQNPESSPTTEPATAEIPTETPTTVATTEPTTPTSEATTETPPPETTTPAIITTTETTTPTIETTPPATTTIEPTSLPTETPAISSTSPIPTPSETPILTPTLTLTPTDTPTLTPTLEVTPTPIPGDTIPIDAAPTGELLLYQAWQGGVGEDAISSFHILPLDSGEGIVQPIKVTFGTGFDMYINSVSPDGRYTLLLKDVGSVIGGLPHIYDRETGEIKSFFEDSPSIAGLGKDWSFDSKKVLFWSGDIGGLWLLNAETSEKTLLTAVGGSVQGASISPSGEQIAFIDTGKKAYNALWLVEATGGKPQWIFDIDGPSGVLGWTLKGILFLEGDPEGLISVVEPGSDQRLKLNAPVDTTFGLPTRLSPDRTKLAFTGTPNQAPDCTQAEDPFPCLLPYFDVYVLDIVENKVINLGEGIYPEWSPTGQEVAFVSFRTGKSEVWLVNIDGSNLRQVSNDGLNKSQAFWLKEKGQ